MKRRSFILSSVAGSAYLSSPFLASAGTEKTVVFQKGSVLPVDQAFSEHSAFAIRGGKILGVGTDSDMIALAGSGAQVIDLEGRTILPGFIEPHMHLTLIAALGEFPDVGPFTQGTFEKAIAALKKAAAELKSPDDWLFARQFDPSLLSPQRDLTVRELDEIAPDRPAFVLNASIHIAYVNTKALELVGYTKDTPDMPGAKLGRFKDGSLSGVLYGQAAFGPVMMLDKKIKNNVGAGLGAAVTRVGETAAALGITTLCDMSSGAAGGMTELETIQNLYIDKQMKSRVRAFIFDLGRVKLGEIDPFWGDDFYRAVGWKIVSDGSNQGYTGRQRAPFYSRLTLGEFYVEPKDLIERLQNVSQAGWPMAIHSNGDAAIDSTLNAVEYAQRNGVKTTSLRHRIEHCSILHDNQIQRMSDLGLSPSFLINHVHFWGQAMRDEIFGPRKVQLLDRCASVEAAGLVWTVHTDTPVTPLGSLHNIGVAVNRTMWKEPETVLAPNERVPVETAIRAVTGNAAWQCHSDKTIGSLEQGKLADFVVLEKDPRKVAPSTISDIKVSQTWMNGDQVFSA